MTRYLISFLLNNNASSVRQKLNLVSAVKCKYFREIKKGCRCNNLTGCGRSCFVQEMCKLSSLYICF